MPRLGWTFFHYILNERIEASRGCFGFGISMPGSGGNLIGLFLLIGGFFFAAGHWRIGGRAVPPSKSRQARLFSIKHALESVSRGCARILANYGAQGGKGFDDASRFQIDLVHGLGLALLRTLGQC